MRNLLDVIAKARVDDRLQIFWFVWKGGSGMPSKFPLVSTPWVDRSSEA